jgi:DNA-binding response OmpR family regulator
MRGRLIMNTTALVNVTNPDGRSAMPVFSTVAKFAKMKILIIDDEPANVALLESILSDNGYTRVNSITDSRLASETCKSFQPDLIMLDLMMPHIDGFAILDALRFETTETFLPIIVLTADANEETKLRALRAGATDFLLKPFDQIEVLLRIGNLLETQHLHIQLDTQRAAFEDAVRARTSELRDALSKLEETNRPFRS